MTTDLNNNVHSFANEGKEFLVNFNPSKTKLPSFNRLRETIFFFNFNHGDLSQPSVIDQLHLPELKFPAGIKWKGCIESVVKSAAWKTVLPYRPRQNIYDIFRSQPFVYASNISATSNLLVLIYIQRYLIESKKNLQCYVS